MLVPRLLEGPAAVRRVDVAVSDGRAGQRQRLCRPCAVTSALYAAPDQRRADSDEDVH